MNCITCRNCAQTKPVDQFHFRNRKLGTRHTWCKDCYCEYMKERRAAMRAKTPYKTRPRRVVEEAFRIGRYTCRECGEEKTLDEFCIRTSKGIRRIPSRCRKCERAAAKRWRKTAGYRQHRVRMRIKEYDLSLEEYDRLRAKQNGVCPICQKPLQFGDEAIDHDHKTEEVRGLLHINCNLMLGNAYDESERLLAGAIYLDERSSKGA